MKGLENGNLRKLIGFGQLGGGGPFIHTKIAQDARGRASRTFSLLGARPP